MKMKRNRALLLVNLGSILLCSISIGVSFAWYIADSRLAIENIEVDVATDRSLQISTSSEEDSFTDHNKDNPIYGTSQSKLDLFKPVSSMYSFGEDWHKDQSWYKESRYSSLHWMKNKEKDPVFVDSYYSSNRKVPSLPPIASSGYYSQHFYLRSDINCYATLDPENCFFNGFTCLDTSTPADTSTYERIHKLNQEQAKKLYPNDVEGYTKTMDEVYKAIRISILVVDEEDYNYTIIDPFKSESETYFASPLNVDYNNDYYDTYKDRDGTEKEILYGDIDESTRDNAVYEKRIEDTTIDTNQLSSFTAYTKEDALHLNLEKSLENGLVAAKEHSYSLVSQGHDNDIGDTYRESDLLIPLTGNVPKEIVVSLYLEGWDRDCINNTMGAYFSSLLSFKVARVR